MVRSTSTFLLLVATCAIALTATGTSTDPVEDVPNAVEDAPIRHLRDRLMSRVEEIKSAIIALAESSGSTWPAILKHLNVAPDARRNYGAALKIGLQTGEIVYTKEDGVPKHKVRGGGKKPVKKKPVKKKPGGKKPGGKKKVIRRPGGKKRGGKKKLRWAAPKASAQGSSTTEQRTGEKAEDEEEEHIEEAEEKLAEEEEAEEDSLAADEEAAPRFEVAVAPPKKQVVDPATAHSVAQGVGTFVAIFLLVVGGFGKLMPWHPMHTYLKWELNESSKVWLNTESDMMLVWVGVLEIIGPALTLMCWYPGELGLELSECGALLLLMVAVGAVLTHVFLGVPGPGPALLVLALVSVHIAFRYLSDPDALTRTGVLCTIAACSAMGFTTLLFSLAGRKSRPALQPYLGPHNIVVVLLVDTFHEPITALQRVSGKGDGRVVCCRQHLAPDTIEDSQLPGVTQVE